MHLSKVIQKKQLLKETIIILFFIALIFILNWIIPEAVRIPFYEDLRAQDLAGSLHGFIITGLISILLIYISIVGWFGVNSATDVGIPRLEIATATFTRSLIVVASMSVILGTIGSSGGEIASALFEGLRIVPDIISNTSVDSAGIFSVYVANFSGVVNAMAAVFAGAYLLYKYYSKRLSKEELTLKVREVGSPAVFVLAIGLFFLYFVQSAVTWDGRPTLGQSSLVVLIGVIVFLIGFNLFKRDDGEIKPKSGRDFLGDSSEKFSLNPKKLGAYLALNTIGNSQNIFVVVPRFVLALSALISMLIVPIEFMLTMFGFDEIVLAFAIAFITSIVEILLVIASGEIALFLLLGSNVIDVIFGLLFGEVVPQLFGSIAYHPSMPAISMYSALFALATFVGILISYFFYTKQNPVSATVSFMFFVFVGGFIYNWAVFFNGVPPMTQFINKYLAYLEYPIYYFSIFIVFVLSAYFYYKKNQKKKLFMDEVLESLSKLKDYFEGAVFVLQVDGDSLKKHLGRISFIIQYLMNAERYLGGDGAITLIIENNLIPHVLTKDSYQKTLTELAHNPPVSSTTILNDTLTHLLDPKYIADISLANNNVPMLFISLQSDLTLDDINNAKFLLENKKQENNVIFEIGCFDGNSTITNELRTLSNVAFPKSKVKNWFSYTEVGDSTDIEVVLETMFDRFSDFVDGLS